jgi:hypothetical protein
VGPVHVKLHVHTARVRIRVRGGAGCVSGSVWGRGWGGVSHIHTSSPPRGSQQIRRVHIWFTRFTYPDSHLGSRRFIVDECVKHPCHAVGCVECVGRVPDAPYRCAWDARDACGAVVACPCGSLGGCGWDRVGWMEPGGALGVRDVTSFPGRPPPLPDSQRMVRYSGPGGQTWLLRRFGTSDSERLSHFESL